MALQSSREDATDRVEIDVGGASLGLVFDAAGRELSCTCSTGERELLRTTFEGAVACRLNDRDSAVCLACELRSEEMAGNIDIRVFPAIHVKINYLFGG